MNEVPRGTALTLSEYESRYHICNGLVQIWQPLRVWKKIVLLTDPFSPVSYFRAGTDYCSIASLESFNMDFGVAELIIPAGALVYGSTATSNNMGGVNTTINTSYRGRVLRASSAQCVQILDGCDIQCIYAYSIYGRVHYGTKDDLKYEPGKTVFPASGFSCAETSLAPGIHFVPTFEDAWNY